MLRAVCLAVASTFALTAVVAVRPLNIMLINDDSWATANIRATCDALKADGHKVVLVAPALQESGHGGQAVYPTTNMTGPGEFNSIPTGARWFGHDVNDPNIFYMNGTPAATAIFGIDVIVPMVLGNDSLDLVVAGPNEGQNRGPFLFTLSGTMGATYASVYKGVPAVAFSATNNTHRPFQDNTGKADDPANTVARLTTQFVSFLANITKPGQPIFPLGTGMAVNYPLFAPGNNCTNPPFVLTRFTGGAAVDQVFISPKDGFPDFNDQVTASMNVVYTGSVVLPGENTIGVNASDCRTTVSMFGVDYDAPERISAPIQAKLAPLFGEKNFIG